METAAVLINPFYSLSFTMPGKKNERDFLNVPIPESETGSQNKHIHNPVPKTGDLKKSPRFIFFNKGKKKHGSIIQHLGHWQILSVLFKISVPGCELCNTY